MRVQTEDKTLDFTPTPKAQDTAAKIHAEILSNATQMGEYTLTSLPTFDGGLSLFYAGRTTLSAGHLRSFSVDADGILTGHAHAMFSEDGTIGDFHPITGGMIHTRLVRRGITLPAEHLALIEASQKRA